MEYLWMRGVAPPKFGVLEGDIDTDVLVIGGGMAGVLAAFFLKEAGRDYVLVEGQSVGGGITKGTTAVLSAQHDTLYSDMIKKFGYGNAKRYLKANLNAVASFRQLSRQIPCDFTEAPSIMYSLDDLSLMKREVEAVRSLGFLAEWTAESPLPYPIAGGVRYPGMAQFHPLKFLYGLAEGLQIFEHTFVSRMEGTTAFTDRGTIRAKKVIIATHFPFINSYGLYFMKLYQKRSFILGLKNAPSIHCTMVDAAENGFYFRDYGDLLLLGGGDHRTGKSEGGFQSVRAFAKRYFPEAEEDCAWATQDCMSLDGVPYIGAYSKNLPDVYVATGFNEWGMTTSMAAAKILVDLVAGRKNRFAEAFDPGRRMVTGQLFTNLGTTMLHFFTPTVKRCSHMGCALKWNAAERSWDCPCHGSRFDAEGRLIDNPAMRDSHVK